MGKSRQLVSLFLFALLVLAKASSLHVFSHEESDPAAIENCSWCHLAVLGQETEFTFSEVQHLEIPEIVLIPDTLIQMSGETIVATLYPTSLFSRPPPAVC